MAKPVGIGEIRWRIASKAAALTGTSRDQIARELGPATYHGTPLDQDRNWSIELLAPSAHVRHAIDQAIRELVAETPVADFG